MCKCVCVEEVGEVLGDDVFVVYNIIFNVLLFVFMRCINLYFFCLVLYVFYGLVGCEIGESC